MARQIRKNFEYTRENIDYFLALSENSPTRFPDWRARLAQYAVGKDSDSKIRMDNITKQIYRYELLKKKVQNSPESALQSIERFFGKNKVLGEAVSIAENLLYPGMAVDLQCFTLACAPIEYICSVFGISPEAYQLYVAIYFDILDRIDKIPYILNFAVFQGGPFDLIDNDNRSRFLSYFCGTEAAKFCRFKLSKGLLKFEHGRPTQEAVKDMLDLARSSITERIYALISSRSAADEVIANLYNAIKEAEKEQSVVAGDAAKELLDMVKWNLKLRDDPEVLREDVEKAKSMTEQVFNNNER